MVDLRSGRFAMKAHEGPLVLKPEFLYHHPQNAECGDRSA